MQDESSPISCCVLRNCLSRETVYSSCSRRWWCHGSDDGMTRRLEKWCIETRDVILSREKRRSHRSKMTIWVHESSRCDDIHVMRRKWIWEWIANNRVGRRRWEVFLGRETSWEETSYSWENEEDSSWRFVSFHIHLICLHVVWLGCQRPKSSDKTNVGVTESDQWSNISSFPCLSSEKASSTLLVVFPFTSMFNDDYNYHSWLVLVFVSFVSTTSESPHQ